MTLHRIPSGIFAREASEHLHWILRSYLPSHGCRLLPENPSAAGFSQAYISAHNVDWSHVEVIGAEKAAEPVLTVLVESVREVVTCTCEPDRHEFAYVHYRHGRPVESFTNGGSAMGAIRFVSEIRHVPIQKILDSRVFMAEAMGLLGLDLGHRRVHARRSLTFTPEERRGFLASLLGAAWRGGNGA